MDAYEFSDVKPVIISAVIVLNIIMNCLVIAVIARYPALREDRTCLFMCSLCVSDLAGACITMPISAALCSRATPTVRLSTRYLPKVQMFCGWWFGFNSMHSISWVALSKMVAILKPLRYEQLLTRNRCYGIIVFNWVVGAALAAAKFTIDVTWNTSICSFRSPADNKQASRLIISTYVVAVVIPGITLIVATVMMLIVVLRTHKQICAQVQSIGGCGGCGGAINTGLVTLRTIRSAKNILIICFVSIALNVPLLTFAVPCGGGAINTGLVTLQTIRSAKNILIICFVSIALNFPLLTFAVLRHATYNQQIARVFSFSAAWLYNCNSFMNSFLYLILYRSVRKKIVRMFTDMRDYLRRG